VRQAGKYATKTGRGDGNDGWRVHGRALSMALTIASNAIKSPFAFVYILSSG
jgi:hypothetical protein